MINIDTDVQKDLGVKFQDRIAHYSKSNSKFTYCGIPRIELLGFMYPLGGSGLEICSKCKAIRNS